MNLLSLEAKRIFALAMLLSAFVVLPVSAAPAPFTLVGHTPKTLSVAAVAVLTKQTAPAVAAGDTLMFRRKTIRLVVTTGPEDDMLSYRIAGLRNPTLAVPAGATLAVLFINTDDDMLHDIRFGASQKTYPNVMELYPASSAGTLPLPHKSGARLHAEELTVRAPSAPGAYAYFCTVRGHAQGGMVGRIVVH